MSIITNFIQGQIESSKDYIVGKTLTRPALIHSDGIATTYSVDVDTGEEGVVNANGDLGNMVLYNVPIANGNHNLRYAEVGAAVTLYRGATGQWEVVGFAKTHPNSYSTICVEVPQYCLVTPTSRPPGPPIYHPPIIGDPVYYGQELRPLVYGELAEFSTYGAVPYGAAGVFVNGEFVEWRMT